MLGLLKIYNFPGKLIAELWYLWPKKGQIWASGRRRGHGFVHFMYSSIVYLVAAFVVTGSAGEKRSDAIAETSSETLHFDERGANQKDDLSYAQPTPAVVRIDESKVEATKEEVTPESVNEQNFVVQDAETQQELSMNDADLEK